MAVRGNFITDFLDKRESGQPVTDGVYQYEKQEEEYLDDIDDGNWSYRVRRKPATTLTGQPGLVEIYATSVTITEVFSTSDATPATYVDRNWAGQTYDTILYLALLNSGKTVVLHGPSKLGKTAAWRGPIVDAVEVQCAPNLDADKLYGHIHTALGNPYLVEYSHESATETGISTDLKVKFGTDKLTPVEWSAKADQKETDREGKKYKVPEPVATCTQVAKELAQAKKVLVFENYHRLTVAALKQVAIDLRVFADHKVTTLFVGIPEDPYVLVHENPELEGRVDFLPFTFWSQDDLRRIARGGEKTLNVSFDEETLTFLSEEAAGSPFLMQDFCFLACIASDVQATQSESATVSLTKSLFKTAMVRFYANKFHHFDPIQNSIIKVAGEIKSLPDQFVPSLVAAIRRTPALSIRWSELKLGTNPRRAASAFVRQLNMLDSTRDIFSVDINEEMLKVCRPLYITYVRWIMPDN